MRVTSVLVLAIALVTSVAHAEKVKTNQTAKIYNRPGERGQVIVKVKSGQNMTLLAQDGRWLKVRVQGRTGYVPRSKVDMADGDEIVRNTRRRAFVDGRSTHRGFGGESPDDRVGADATETKGGGGDDEGDKGGGDDEEKPAAKTKPPKHKPEKEKPEKEKPEKEKPSKPSKSSKGGGGDDEEEDGGKSSGSDEDEPKVSDEEEGAAEEQRATARVSEKTVIYSEPDKESEQSFVAKPSMTLYPSEVKGKWTFVETDDGSDSGWVQTSKIDVDEGGGGSGGPRKREIDVRARLGVTFMQQGMRAAGGATMFPDVYNVGTSAATVALGGGVLFPYGKQALVGGELAYNFAKAIPGIYYKDPMATGAGANIGVTLHDVNVRGIIGYDLKKKNGMAVFGRLGYRYEGFIVDGNTPYDPTKNPAKLPSEVTTGITVGGALAIPRLTDKIGIKLAVDAMLIGVGITQTKALEDGSKPSAKAYCLGAGFNYRWKPDMDLQATYDLNYGSYDFGPPLASSMRGHAMTATDVTRTDIFHTVTFGLAKGF
jgi:SH3-like domain-containing protein